VIALDLLAYSAGDEMATQFLHGTDIPSVTHKVLAHTLAAGIAFIYEGMQEGDIEAAMGAFRQGTAQVLIATVGMCWNVTVRGRMVAVLDTLKYEGREKHYVDYTIAEVLSMLGRAGRQGLDSKAEFVLLCHTPKKDFYKKFLREPIPLESHLDHYLTDHFNAELVSKTITSRQDAVDWLTWTFLYRRLGQNPNYYGLQGMSGAHLNAYLSESVEKTLEELFKAELAQEGEELQALNPGIIAAYYYLKAATLQTFAESLTASLRVRGLIEVLAAAQEFETLPVRHGDDRILREISRTLHEPVAAEYFNDPHTKAKTLLLAHCQRLPLPSDLSYDQRVVLEQTSRLVHAMVDMLSSSAWLKPALMCMTLSQHLIQAVTERDSPLCQLPHFPPDRVNACVQAGVCDLVDLMNMEDEQRRALLGMTEEQIADVARVCNGYPSLTLHFRTPSTVNREDSLKIALTVERDGDPAPVYAPYYPLFKEEGWWAAIGDPQSNRLYAIKKFTLGTSTSITLSFPAPEPGQHQLTLYVMSDCYVGADQGEQFTFTVCED
jgi:pre-mRNA-splicing helicase BRR2